MFDFVLNIFYTTWTKIECKIVFLAAVLTTSMHSTPHLIIQCRLSSTYKKGAFLPPHVCNFFPRKLHSLLGYSYIYIHQPASASESAA